VLGLAILAALYFSQARDVKRLREWAGRAPERVVEAEAGGRPAVQPVPGRVTPPVGAAKPAAAGAAAAKPAGAGAAAGAAGAATGDGADAPAKPGAPAKPVPAGATASAKEAEAADADAVAPESEEAGDAEKAGVPAAATPAGAAASGAAAGVPAVASAAGAAAATTSERGAAATGGAAAGAGAPARRFGNGEGGEPPRDTQTGVKVLPAERAMAPVRRPPTLPRTGGQTAVLTEPPGGGRTGSRWPAPRYIALIVAGVIVLGLGGVVGVMELTKEEKSQKSGSNPPETDIGDPTREPDKPEPTRVNPADVTVAVFNTTQTTGLASRISSRLQSAGFQPGNIAQAGQRQRAESVVMFKPGANDEARAVARRLDISQIEPIDQASQALAGTAQVVVLLGADKASQ
jgi:LytR cell envelope-related transcriptional attenuator